MIFFGFSDIESNSKENQKWVSRMLCFLILLPWREEYGRCFRKMLHYRFQNTKITIPTNIYSTSVNYLYAYFLNYFNIRYIIYSSNILNKLTFNRITYSVSLKLSIVISSTQGLLLLSFDLLSLAYAKMQTY